MHTHLHGVGTGFQYGDDAFRPYPAAQGRQGGPDGSWMVGEIIIYRNAMDFR